MIHDDDDDVLVLQRGRSGDGRVAALICLDMNE